MFKKVHIRLTLLCTGITAVIMIIMSLCYLYVSENGLYRNQFQSFQNDVNTITTNLEQQSVISMEWLSKMEAQGNYLFYVLDNGIPFLYNQLNDMTENSTRSLLLEECRNAYQDKSTASFFVKTDSSYISSHFEFEFVSASTDAKYFGSIINLGKYASSLEIIILSSMQSLEEQILEQRFRFILIDIAAVFLLSIFSWLFTGRLLRPIMENQQKQAQFVASASHELRTPLAVILSAAECCRNAPPEKQKVFLKTIDQEGLRMSALVNDMLTLSSSDDQRFSIQPEPVEIDTLLMNSYEAFEPLARDKSILLSVCLPEQALPLCQADPERISQVVAILLHNAISYTPAYGRITLSLLYKKEHFYLSVQDNGIGISDEDKKRIFDRFYRVEKSRSTKEHFGLGLSIAYEIIKAHNGSIQVADAKGGGSIFTIIL
ncbi:MAG: HAMP domain-containing histidine kinase [Blautia sp.]|nr:HAMP domain-containing histidine kinase [Blautia sp.]MCM1200331.1 HAMP domain-containing histidine kinase [Bacteroides fragilis]